jgi:predicted Zn finger-like uncharacterized protein
MIVACPACHTRYLVDDADLGGEDGRRVRCSSCGNVWRYSAEAALIQMAVAEATAEVEAAAGALAVSAPTAVPSQVAQTSALRAEPGTQGQPYQLGPAAVVRPAVVVELPGASGRSTATATGLALLVLAATLVPVAILARDRIKALYPPAAPVYEALRLTAPPTALEITSTLTRTADSLIVAGDIVNGTRAPQHVTRLRITLRDGTKSDLESKVIDLPVAELPGGQTVQYTAVFEHPSITATAADVTFTAE